MWHASWSCLVFDYCKKMFVPSPWRQFFSRWLIQNRFQIIEVLSIFFRSESDQRQMMLEEKNIITRWCFLSKDIFVSWVFEIYIGSLSTSSVKNDIWECKYSSALSWFFSQSVCFIAVWDALKASIVSFAYYYRQFLLHFHVQWRKSCSYAPNSWWMLSYSFAKDSA